MAAMTGTQTPDSLTAQPCLNNRAVQPGPVRAQLWTGRKERSLLPYFIYSVPATPPPHAKDAVVEHRRFCAATKVLYGTCRAAPGYDAFRTVP